MSEINRKIVSHSSIKSALPLPQLRNARRVRVWEDDASVLHRGPATPRLGRDLGARRPSGDQGVRRARATHRLHATSKSLSTRPARTQSIWKTFNCFQFQELALYGEFTIRETLIYFGWIAGMSSSHVDEKIDFLVNLLQLPSVTRFVKNLSGGQQRRMSLAAALVHGQFNEPP